MVLGHWCERSNGGPIDFNELRTQLGLPTLDPIEPAPGEIETLPAIRLDRVIVERLSDEDLVRGFHRVIVFNARDAMRKFGQAIVDRPSFADKPERLQAFSILAQSAQTSEGRLEEH